MQIDQNSDWHVVLMVKFDPDTNGFFCYFYKELCIFILLASASLFMWL